jgi:SAM-dependent methyltransferase
MKHEPTLPPAPQNQALWDYWSSLHTRSSSDYAAMMERLRGGGISLEENELEEIGPVHGKSLLHLQCHIGLDTLSWVRLGAEAVGVDYSAVAIRSANSLAQETGLLATFIQSDVYDLPNRLERKFDLVYASEGVLIWLPDLNQWAKIAAGFLKPGGIFYLRDFHPARKLLLPRRVDGEGNPIQIGYFPSSTPVEVKERGSYAAPDDDTHTAYYWPHSLGEVVTSLCSAGFRIQFLHEFPKLIDICQSYQKNQDGSYQAFYQTEMTIPHLFSIRAVLE